PKLPLVTVLMVIEAGATTDPAGRDGLAQLTARLLPEGTERSTGAEFAERLERLGASVEAHADWDVGAARVTVLAGQLDEAMPLFGEMLRAPAFPEREVERLKAERLAELLQIRAEPGALADEMFARFTYEPASRYSRPAGGAARDVEAIARGDVVRFYEARYRPAGMTLVAAGDVTADQIERLARATFGDWMGAPAGADVTSDAPARQTRAVHVVAKADAPQSELRVGHPGIPRNTPDYFPTVVMNAVLGGLFSSRINLNLREAHGYTYGAFSRFDWRRRAGPFAVDTAVKTVVTDAAAREILHEIDRMRAEEIRPEELSLATSYLDGVFPIRYETTDAIAAALGNLVVYELPDDYFDRYRERVRAVTAAGVLAAARAHLHPDRMQIVAVGDPDAVRAPLEALGLGPVTVYDADGKPAG
ncbi:MAG: insulinase family protein, partial [Gemmatimonadota bacterium]|nr:insulinase family protein [Gemmatimonadota bacterium]